MPDGAESGVSRRLAEQFNRECFCLSLDSEALDAAIRGEAAEAAELIGARPHLFSQAQVFLPESDLGAMAAVVNAAEAAARLQGYREAALSRAPVSARTDFGPRGAFMGYDFHLTEQGPKLIEINTNAGGAFLNAFLARAQIACCVEVKRGLVRNAVASFEGAVAAMFEAEWRAQRLEGRPGLIAIVDDDPAQQYLYPEFVLAQRLLQRHGFDALIADAASLRYENGALTVDGRRIDLVYNRLVDFALDAPAHASLRAAYLDGAVVLTPNPRNHALFADKRNLALLSNAETMTALGLEPAHVRALTGVPKTREVRSADAARLWEQRRRFYFKPVSGHGGKAVYRGDKLTRSAWETVLAGDYIAQELVRPSERTILLDGERVQRKLDVRLYTYEGEALLAAARLYQGQTTNFRTAGGGFAPVFFI